MLRLSWAIEHRSCAVQTPDVREKIIARLRDGVLPRAPADKLYGGVGSNTTCACCDGPISRDQLEFEVEFAASPPDTPQMVVVMHPQCLRVWYDECRA
jgi:hypothetical protein